MFLVDFIQISGIQGTNYSLGVVVPKDIKRKVELIWF